MLTSMHIEQYNMVSETMVLKIFLTKTHEISLAFALRKNELLNDIV
jgi:hypothetical protein